MILESVPLSTLATVRSGGGAPQAPAAFTATGFPFVRAGSLPLLVEGAPEESLERLEFAVAEAHGLSLFPADTVLFAKSGMSATKGWIYRLRRPAYVVNHLAALVPHDPAGGAFLVHVLRRFPPTVLIKDSAYPSIRLGDIENMRVLSPRDTADRRRIMEVLDRADGLRVQRRATLAQLDTLTQSLFLDMFGDPATAAGGRRLTVRECLADGILFDVQDGNHGERHPKVEDFVPVGVPFITANCLRGGRLNLADCYFLESRWLETLRVGFAQGGDVLMSHKGTIGQTAVVPDFGATIILSPQVTYYRTNRGRLHPEFLHAYFETAFFQSKMKKEAEQTTRAYLGITRQMDLPLLVPGSVLQSEFARRVTAVEKLKVSHRASLAQLDALSASLQHRAFRGEL